MASKINFLVHKQSKHAERVHTVAMATKMKEKKNQISYVYARKGKAKNQQLRIVQTWILIKLNIMSWTFKSDRNLVKFGVNLRPNALSNLDTFKNNICSVGRELSNGIKWVEIHP